jgi:hypothetical protein
MKVLQSPVKLTLSKDTMGLAHVAVEGVGSLDNTHQPIALPIHLSTDSSLAKLSFSGVSIEGLRIEELKGTSVRPVAGRSSIYIANPGEEAVSLNLTANLSIEEELPTVVLEKGDPGTFSAKIGDYEYFNKKTGARTIKNLPVTIEMTSNKTQVFFEEGGIAQGTILQLDGQDLQQSVIGDDFLYLSYSHDGSSFRRASYRLDLNLSNKSKLVIYKNNAGFVNVKLGEKSYFSTDMSKDQPYISGSYRLDEIPIEKSILNEISVPVTIETTSDWTDISLEGFEAPEFQVIRSEGSLGQPGISGGRISLSKNSLGDTSFARLDGVLKARGQQEGWITIAKGDLGYTTVRIEQTAVFKSSGKVEGSSRNSRRFKMPELPRAVNPDLIYNPAAYFFPAYPILYERGLTMEEVRPGEVSLTVGADELPGWGLRMRASVAGGVMAYAILSYLILSLFGLLVLFREGYFSFLPERKPSGEYLRALVVGTLERMPVSSVLVLEALIALAITPFILLKSEAMANGTAILAYLLLVAGVAVRFVEMKEMLRLDRQKEVLIKILCLAVLVAAGFIAAFELMKVPVIVLTVIGPFGLIGMVIISGIFLVLAYLYLKDTPWN